MQPDVCNRMVLSINSRHEPDLGEPSLQLLRLVDPWSAQTVWLLLYRVVDVSILWPLRMLDAVLTDYKDYDLKLHFTSHWILKVRLQYRHQRIPSRLQSLLKLCQRRSTNSLHEHYQDRYGQIVGSCLVRGQIWRQHYFIGSVRCNRGDGFGRILSCCYRCWSHSCWFALLVSL